MTDVEFTVRFRAEAPNPLRVGDEIAVAGVATVRAIEAELVDVTKIGSEITYLPGEIKVALSANRFKVGP